MNVPVGDVNSSGHVDGDDASAGAEPDAPHSERRKFPYDVNVIGGIHGNDVSVNQNQTRQSLP